MGGKRKRLGDNEMTNLEDTLEATHAGESVIVKLLNGSVDVYYSDSADEAEDAMFELNDAIAAKSEGLFDQQLRRLRMGEVTKQKYS